MPLNIQTPWSDLLSRSQRLLRRTNPAGKEGQELYSSRFAEILMWNRSVGGSNRHSPRVFQTEGSLWEGPSWSLPESSGTSEESSA